MRCACRAHTHVMPAASSLTRTVATHPRADDPERLSGRTLDSPHVGHPILIMSPDLVRGPR